MDLPGGFPPTGINFDSATQLQNKKPPCRVVSVLELLGGFEPPTSSLPSDKKPSSRWYIRLCGHFCRKKDEVENYLLHVLRPFVSACGSRCGSASDGVRIVTFYGAHILRYSKQREEVRILFLENKNYESGR